MAITRSENMRRIKSHDTQPERQVRTILRSLGFSGYRLHRKDIPGEPDLAYIGRRKLIFVHGCFWHGHQCPKGARVPKSNAEYWRQKLLRNRQRDEEVLAKLSASGWAVLIVWECEIRHRSDLLKKLDSFLRA